MEKVNVWDDSYGVNEIFCFVLALSNLNFDQAFIQAHGEHSATFLLSENGWFKMSGDNSSYMTQHSHFLPLFMACLPSQ